MKNKRQLVVSFCALILAIILPLTIIACNPYETEDEREYNRTRVYINSELARCRGLGLTRKDLAGIIAHFDEIEAEYGGKEIVKGFPPVPHFIMEFPEDYEATENTRYDVGTLDEDEHYFIAGIEIVPYEIDAPAESDATGITEEPTAELTSETTATETTSESVEDYKALLVGKWKNTETGISMDYKGLYDYFESAGTSIEYSIDGDTGGLKVTCKGETEGLSIDEYEIYVFEDKDHMKYTKVDKGTTVCDSVPHVRADE